MSRKDGSSTNAQKPANAGKHLMARRASLCNVLVNHDGLSGKHVYGVDIFALAQKMRDAKGTKTKPVTPRRPSSASSDRTSPMSPLAPGLKAESKEDAAEAQAHTAAPAPGRK